MPSGQFNTVVISVSDILPLDKGHYISVSGIACWEIREKNECIRQLMHFFCDLGMTSKRIAKIRLKRLFKQALLCYPIEEAVELDVFCPAWCISSRSDRYDIA